jgi:hypothetical protein
MAVVTDTPKQYRPHDSERLRRYQREWQSKNRDKASGYTKKWRAKNKDKYNEYQRAWRNKERDKPSGINERKRARYAVVGKSKAAADRAATHKANHQKNLELLAARPKPDTCDVCGSGGKIVFDHCHRTLNFIGWLCNGCNRALGFIDDDPHRLRMLAAYLERTKDGQGAQLTLSGV